MGEELSPRDVFSMDAEQKWKHQVYLEGLNSKGEWSSNSAAADESDRIRLCESGKDKSKRTYTYAKTYGYVNGTNPYDIRARLERSRAEIIESGLFWTTPIKGECIKTKAMF